MKPNTKFLSATFKFNSKTNYYESDIEVLVDGKKLVDSQSICPKDFENYVMAMQLEGKFDSLTQCPYRLVLEDRIIKVAKHLQVPESLYQQCIDEAFVKPKLEPSAPVNERKEELVSQLKGLFTEILKPDSTNNI